MSKPRSKLADFAVYLAVRVIVCFLQALSFRAACKVADGLAWLAYQVDRRHRLVALDNLRHAFGDGGGALMNQAIHNVDLLLWLMGPVKHINGFTSTLAHERIEVEDTAVACLRFKNDALGVIQATTSVHPGLPKTIAVHGNKGTVVIEQDDVLRWELTPETEEDRAVRQRFAVKSGASGGSGNPAAISHTGHARQLADFVRAIETGGQPLVDGREGRKAVEVILGIYRAAQTGSVVEIA